MFILYHHHETTGLIHILIRLFRQKWPKARGFGTFFSFPRIGSWYHPNNPNRGQVSGWAQFYGKVPLPCLIPRCICEAPSKRNQASHWNQRADRQICFGRCLLPAKGARFLGSKLGRRSGGQICVPFCRIFGYAKLSCNVDTIKKWQAHRQQQHATWINST